MKYIITNEIKIYEMYYLEHMKCVLIFCSMCKNGTDGTDNQVGGRCQSHHSAFTIHHCAP